MKDFLGQELSMDDEVVFVQLGYRNLLKGKIIRLTPQTIVINHEKTNIGDTQTRQTPSQVIKIPINQKVN